MRSTCILAKMQVKHVKTYIKAHDEFLGLLKHLGDFYWFERGQDFSIIWCKKTWLWSHHLILSLFSIQSLLIFYVSSSSYMEKAEFLLQSWPGSHCDQILLVIGISLLTCMLFRRWSLQRNPEIDLEGKAGEVKPLLFFLGWWAGCTPVHRRELHQGAPFHRLPPCWKVWQAVHSETLFLAPSCFGESRYVVLHF